MQTAYKIGKKALTWGVVSTTIAWSVGLSAMLVPFAAKATPAAGSLVKTACPARAPADHPCRAVYYVDAAGSRHVFVHKKIYDTWYADFSMVQTVSDADLAALPRANAVKVRPGTYLLNESGFSKVWAVEGNGSVRVIGSEAAAVALYGSAWASRVRDLPSSLIPVTDYPESATAVDGATYPVGMLVRSGSDVWYIDAGQRRKVTPDGMTANRFREEFVVTANAAVTLPATIGPDISTGLAAFTDASQTGGVGTAPVSGGTGLTISTGSLSPVSGSVVTDTVDGGQALVGFLHARFTASADGAVTVTTVKVTRSGISADADLGEIYLYEGDNLNTQIARSSSIASGKISFTNAAGLFTVPAGGTKDVMVRANIGTNVTSGKTIALSINSGDVVASGTVTVTGSSSGNTMTVASVTDLGQLEITNVSPSAAATVDPGVTGYELWRFRFDANDENLLIKKITFTQVGSIDGDDIQNFALYDGATQLGSVIPMLSSDNRLTFDLSGMTDGGYKLISGQNKQLALRGDILGGTNRTYRFTIQEQTHVVAWDLNYNVYTIPVADGTESFSVQQPNSSGTAVNTTINTGRVTIGIGTDPTGNIPDGATGVLVGRFTFTAAGENMRITALTATCTSGDGTTLLDNVKFIWNGSQVGTTDTAGLLCDNGTDTDAQTFSNSFIAPAGTTQNLDIVADLTDSTVANADSVQLRLSTGSSNAEGRISLATQSTSAASGRTLTVRGGTITVTENLGMPDFSSSNPTGVVGGRNIKIGSFVITGGGEAADVTQIVLADDMDADSTGDTMADVFQNLRLVVAATGAQYGNTVSTLTDTESTSYTFTPATPLRVSAGGTVAVDIVADIQSGASAALIGTDVNANDTDGVIIVSSAAATGVTTGQTVSDTDGISSLQTLSIVTNGGNLTVTASSDSPPRQMLVAGATSQTLAKFDFTASVDEDIRISRIIVADGMSGGGATAATGTLISLKLVNDVTGAQVGSVVASLDSTSSTSTPIADFDGLNLVVPKNQTVKLAVKADINTYPAAVSSSVHRLRIRRNYTDAGTTAESVTATGVDSGFSISTTRLDMNGTNTSDNNDVDAMRADGFTNVFRTKITVAHSGRLAGGTASPSGEQSVAEFRVSNTANAANTPATLELMNLDIGSTISAAAGSTRNIRLYVDSVSPTTRVYSTPTDLTGGSGYVDTVVADGGATDYEISGGSSRLFVVTVDTTPAAVNNTLNIGLDVGDIEWGDNPIGSSEGTDSITEVESLPVPGITWRY